MEARLHHAEGFLRFKRQLVSNTKLVIFGCIFLIERLSVQDKWSWDGITVVGCHEECLPQFLTMYS